MARPSIFTKETIQKLEEAFAYDCTDQEACFYADISPASLYNYQAQNPEFLERKEALKQSPIFKARKAVIAGFKANPMLALKYLERKRKSEFSPPKTIMEVKSETQYQLSHDNPRVREVTERYEHELRKVMLEDPAES